MPPRMRSRSAGRPAAESLGGGTGVRVGRGGRGKIPREEFCPSHEMQNLEIDLWNHAMRIERYVYGLALQIREMVAAIEPNTMQKAMQVSGALTDEAIRNGSIKKVEKRGNVGEPSKDKNGRDDNKRNRIGNVFATTVSPVGRENEGTWPKCATCNSYHAPEGPCRTCFNCNRPGHLAKDSRSVPKNVNPINARNPPFRACYECGIDPSDLGFRYEIEISSGQLVEIDKVNKCCKLEIEGHVFNIDLIPFGHESFDVIIDEKIRQLKSAKAKDKKQREIFVVRDFPEDNSRNSKTKVSFDQAHHLGEHRCDLLYSHACFYSMASNSRTLLTEDKMMAWQQGMDLNFSLCKICLDSHKHLYFDCPAKVWKDMKSK
nr:hypothetical protein [Tanacetum cinerariifolium]